jgi:hypothetical protein
VRSAEARSDLLGAEDADTLERGTFVVVQVAQVIFTSRILTLAG